MSRYTMTLAELMERYSPGSDPFSLMDIGKMAKDAEPFLFPVPYPIWDEDYRNVLNTKIITHYLYREIGFDTPARFIFELCNKLNEVMPYYNQLYKLQLDGLQSLIDMDLYEEYMGEGVTHDVKSDTQSQEHKTEGDRETHESDDGTSYSYTTYGKQNSVEETGTDTTTKDYGKIDTTTYHNVQDTATYNSSNVVDYDSQDKKTGQDVNRFSNTPQGALTGILQDRYLTTATVDDIDETTARTGSDTTSHKGTDTSTRTGSEDTSQTGKDTDTTDYDKRTTSQDSGQDKTDNGSNNTATTTEEYLDKKLSTISGNTDASGTKSDSYLKHTWGRTGAKDIVEEVMQLRDAIINIDMMIINDLNDLFMGLY